MPRRFSGLCRIILCVRLSEALADLLLPEGKGLVSITGGGGKTTLLSLLGKELSARGLSVLLTTTTKVMSPHLHDYGVDRIFEDESVLSYIPHNGERVFYAEHHTLDMKKWISPREEVISALCRIYDVVIAEADGSKGLPLKMHTERDPVINPNTTATIAVMGGWGIGDMACFSVFGEERDIPVDRDYLQWYLMAPEGLCKGRTDRFAIIINGAEKLSDDTMRMLDCLEYPEGAAVFAASEKEDRIHGTIR